MNTIRNLLLSAAIALTGITACNYTVGECWPVGQGGGSSSEAVTAGGGVIIPTGPAGSGDYGNAPPKQPQDAPDSPKLKCNSDDEEEDNDAESTESQCNASDAANSADSLAICSTECAGKCGTSGVNGGPFSSSIFKFVTIVADDGTGTGGGWQQAVSSLRIVRLNYLVIPEVWHCPVTIGMPLRTTINGPISHKLAASITAQVANQAAIKVRSESPDLPQGIFCLTIKNEMGAIFLAQHKTVGASVK